MRNAMPEQRETERLSSPTIYLVRMVLFLIIAGFIALFLERQIVRAFDANPGLNGVILAVLAIGIVLAIREVVRLYPEIAWVNGLGHSPPPSDKRPVLLAPMAQLLGQDDSLSTATFSTATFSTTTWRAVMDSIATRLDEGRETLRYITGLLIFLGLLGTFWGLLETIGSIGAVIGALQGNADTGVLFDDLKNGIARPLAGMSLSFTASLFGLAGSLVMGFLDLQAGQAHSRFYTDLENSLATRTIVSTGGDETLSPGLRQAIGRISGAVDAAKEQASTAAMASLAEGIQQLVQHMRSEQQMIRDWADAQATQHAEVKRLIDHIAAEAERR
jgi:hypothetical protein